MNRLQAAEKRYANLKHLWQQAEKEVGDLKVQNADLMVALKEVKLLLDDIYAEDVISSGELSQAYEKVEKALAQVKGDQS